MQSDIDVFECDENLVVSANTDYEYYTDDGYKTGHTDYLNNWRRVK